MRVLKSPEIEWTYVEFVSLVNSRFLDLKPLKIDYRMKSSGSVPIVQKSQGKYYDPHRDNPSSIVFRESTLDENWHSCAALLCPRK